MLSREQNDVQIPVKEKCSRDSVIKDISLSCLSEIRPAVVEKVEGMMKLYPLTLDDLRGGNLPLYRLYSFYLHSARSA